MIYIWIGTPIFDRIPSTTPITAACSLQPHPKLDSHPFYFPLHGRIPHIQIKKLAKDADKTSTSEGPSTLEHLVIEVIDQVINYCAVI